MKYNVYWTPRKQTLSTIGTELKKKKNYSPKFYYYNKKAILLKHCVLDTI